ncbi:MAG: hypothetical protein KAX19_09215, partial [Candidatus Brocadiae bacterium]|nr:hypothetical protein [Candidatus Brocadiia bacterium]
MKNEWDSQYVLGLDIGSNSIGWALLGLQDDRPLRITHAGVRVFDPGLDKIETTAGKGQGRAVERRQARGQRRVLRRRAGRLRE